MTLRQLAPRAIVGLLTISTLVATGACTQAPLLEGRVQGLRGIVDTAEKNGAMRCAPRELALAKAHLRFATVELDQGELSEAAGHLEVADPNARAALAMSPIERCGEHPALPGDRDSDGYPDAEDKCPDQPETWNTVDDEDGCPDDPDTDGDKITDSKDQCILLAEDTDGYLDDDGCPEPDNDLDGILDASDKCPTAAEDPDGFEDTDGCPDKDNDNDSVLDVDDFCPNTAGQPGGQRPGCPGLVVVTAREIRITQQIHFDFNKAVIKSDSFGILDAVRDVMVANPKMTIEVQGHTDNVGNANLNAKLSQSRADAVKKYLTTHGIDAARLTSKGYGMTQPIVPNTTADQRALNRRVQFIRTEKP
jgi:OOP family OmpA-OmpF porin